MISLCYKSDDTLKKNVLVIQEVILWTIPYISVITVILLNHDTTVESSITFYSNKDDRYIKQYGHCL